MHGSCWMRRNLTVGWLKRNCSQTMPWKSRPGMTSRFILTVKRSMSSNVQETCQQTSWVLLVNQTPLFQPTFQKAGRQMLPPTNPQRQQLTMHNVSNKHDIALNLKQVASSSSLRRTQMQLAGSKKYSDTIQISSPPKKPQDNNWLSSLLATW